MNNKVKIRIVGPDGSMQDWFLATLKKSGINLIDLNSRTKRAATNVPWIESVTLQRPQEIPLYLKEGYFDLAVVGEDWLANWAVDFPKQLVISIGRQSNSSVKIVLAVPENCPWSCSNEIPNGAVIATEYMGLAERLFAQSGQIVKIIPSYGNTEQKVLYGADAIIDVTETGYSIKQNGLKIIATIMTSGMAIVAHPGSLKDQQKAKYIEHFIAVLKGTLDASIYVRIEANVQASTKSQACGIMHGLKGVTVAPLSIDGWFSITGYIPAVNEQEVIFALMQIGVKDIAVSREASMIMGCE